MRALDCGLVACHDHHRGHRGQQVCAGNLQTARQAAFPVGIGYRRGIQPGNAGCHCLCVRAHHDQYLRWCEIPRQPHHAVYQGLALPGEKLLGLAKSGAPAGSKHDDRMRVSHLPCAPRHCCSCAAMLSEIASGPAADVQADR